MKVNQVIEYLKNEQIATAIRFQVLTGFDTQLGGKRGNTADWVAKLSQAGILEKLGSKEFYQGGNMLTAGASWLMGKNETLDVTMKNLYKTAIVDEAHPQKNKQAYIAKVAGLLEKYQAEDCFETFEFDEPTTVIANMMKPVVSEKSEALAPTI